MTQRWALPLEGAGLVAPPVKHASGYLVVTTTGKLLVVDAASGEVKKQIDTRRPLSGAPMIQGDDIYCPGLDGAVYIIPLADLEG
jgi:hypothetical protein